MKISFHLISVLAILLVTSCKKENTNFNLQGTVRSGNNSVGLPAAYVEVQKQVVNGGTFGATYSTAVLGATDGSGNYKVNWPRENFAALKLIVSKSQYIRRESNLLVDDFSGGNTVTKDMTLYPEAFIDVRIQNTGEANSTDVFKFTFTNANFDCLCCSNGFKIFAGSAVDTAYQCRLYGDTWLKYQKQKITLETDSVVNDSIWCPAFITTDLNISY